MRRTIAVLAVSAVLATAAASVAFLPKPSSADTIGATATFEVPANDGYGVGDCLAGGGACARMVADAWCQSQGFARAEGYDGAAEEVTGSIVAVVATAVPRGAVSVTCAR